MAEAFRINSTDIMHETIDGEVVVVNLDTGAYYAFGGSGEYIWNRLSEGLASSTQLVDELCSLHSTSRERISADVTNFLHQLVNENLIESTPAGTDSGPTIPAAKAHAEFEPPQFNKYTDMEALLLADPIHEVEADGWPNINESAQ